MVWEKSDIIDAILSYLEVPALGVCAQVSRIFHDRATDDDNWESHLKVLLEYMFDSAYMIEEEYKDSTFTKRQRRIVPVSQRWPPRSTEFAHWQKQWLKDLRFLILHDQVRYLEDDLDRKSEKYWLLEDVPLRTYYYEAARYGWKGIHSRIKIRQGRKVWSGEGSTTADSIDWETLGKSLPNISLFHCPFDYLSDFKPRCKENIDCFCANCPSLRCKYISIEDILCKPIDDTPIAGFEAMLAS